MALVALPRVAAAVADLELPPGFTARLYVTGQGFDPATSRGGAGIPSTATMAMDENGFLYLARTGRRYGGGEGDELLPIYRIPPGGGRLTVESEARFLHGPPLPNPQVAAVKGPGDVLVTTFDRERRIGVLYRLKEGRAHLLAGGSPPEGEAPLLRQPEGAAADARGTIYVADREQGAIVRLDATGRALDARYVSVTRPRVLSVDGEGTLWIGADANAPAPWQAGPGEIWRVALNGTPALVLRGPVPAAISLSPGGNLFVADRQAGQIFAITPTGRRVDFARFSEGSAPRSLTFAPVTSETRRAGLAGDLLVVTIRRGTWPVNEVIRIAGPFDELVAGQSEETSEAPSEPSGERAVSP